MAPFRVRQASHFFRETLQFHCSLCQACGARFVPVSVPLPASADSALCHGGSLLLYALVFVSWIGFCYLQLSSSLLEKARVISVLQVLLFRLELRNARPACPTKEARSRLQLCPGSTRWRPTFSKVCVVGC